MHQSAGANTQFIDTERRQTIIHARAAQQQQAARPRSEGTQSTQAGRRHKHSSAAAGSAHTIRRYAKANKQGKQCFVDRNAHRVRGQIALSQRHSTRSNKTSCSTYFKSAVRTHSITSHASPAPSHVQTYTAQLTQCSSTLSKQQQAARMRI